MGQGTSDNGHWNRQYTDTNRDTDTQETERADRDMDIAMDMDNLKKIRSLKALGYIK